MRLYNALVEMVEARAEHIREVTSTVTLGVYARGYKEGQEDAMYCGADCDCDTEAGTD